MQKLQRRTKNEEPGTTLVLPPTPRLKKGDGVQANIEDGEGSMWLIGDVIDTAPDGQVRVHLLGLESEAMAQWYHPEDVRALPKI